MLFSGSSTGKEETGALPPLRDLASFCTDYPTVRPRPYHVCSIPGHQANRNPGTPFGYSFQALSPGHGCPPFGGRLVLPLIGCPGLIALAPPGRRHPRTVLTVRCEQAMETGQGDSGLRYQSGHARDKVQRLENHMRGAIAMR